ncbi:MAG: TerB family tellurite resistance protein [Proteobacteria bacterium]|nr:TerB family tellurite resistance protein [Pseudomonadota bacterium]
MLVLTQSEISKIHQQIKKTCRQEISHALNEGRDFFNSIFPNAVIKAETVNGDKRSPSDRVLDHKIDRIEQWIDEVLDAAIESHGDDGDDSSFSFESIQIPRSLAEKLIETLLRIFACGRNFIDQDYFFISDVSQSLSLDPVEVYYIIEQVQYQIRKEFFESLLEYLDEEHCNLCAILLLKAIRADDRVHPAEIKYFENISQLLNNDQIRLEQVEEECNNFDFNLSIPISEELSVYMFKYLIEIVMCDRKYDPKESQFIQDVAKAFGFDKTRQDEIIQPIASTLMVKADLFQNNY